MITLRLEELLAYTDEEREKWRAWFKSHPDALDIRLQPDGRFATVGALIDHIFLVEVRHILRLQRKELPTETGVAAGDIDGLFAYAARGREAVQRYLPTQAAGDLNTPREVVVSDGTYPLSPRNCCSTWRCTKCGTGRRWPPPSGLQGMRLRETTISSIRRR